VLKTGRTLPGEVAYLPFPFSLAFLGQSVTSVAVEAGRDPAQAPLDTCWDFLRNEETDGNKIYSCFLGACPGFGWGNFIPSSCYVLGLI